MIARKVVRLGNLYADCVTQKMAIAMIEQRIAAQKGGYVVTPNVDHICLAEQRVDLQEAYQHAMLSLADGMPLVWLSQLMRTPLPEKISGSDFVAPLILKAAMQQWRVYLLGGAPGIAERAATVLQREHPRLCIVGSDAPPVGFEHNATQNHEVLARIQACAPHLLLVALGCPKQELWMHQNVARYAPAVAIGIGATFDFIAGAVSRAPRWVSDAGLEWFYRLLQEPRRLAYRYLVRDSAFLPITVRMLRMNKQQRMYDMSF